MSRYEKKQQFVAMLEEAMHSIFRERPLLGLEAARQAYVHDELSLGETAAAVGVSPKQFLELVTRKSERTQLPMSEDLMEMVTEEEAGLLTYLNRRQIELLEKLCERDLLMPTGEAYMSTLWEDLRLLEALNLVVVNRREGLWHYQINLGAAKARY